MTPEQWRKDGKQFDIVAFMDPNAHYGKYYLEDMINGFKYTDCDYITKAAYYAKGELHPGTEHDYVSVMPCKTRTVFWMEAFTVGQIEKMQDGCALTNGYSIDHFEYDE